MNKPTNEQTTVDDLPKGINLDRMTTEQLGATALGLCISIYKREPPERVEKLAETSAAGLMLLRAWQIGRAGVERLSESGEQMNKRTNKRRRWRFLFWTR